MMIIFEGPDGAGKSTAIEQLRNVCYFKVVKHGPYIGKDAEYLMKKYMRPMLNMPPNNQHLVYDRSWLSEPIYGAVFRNGVDRIGVTNRRMLERVAFSVQAVVVLCLPPYAECQRSFQTRKEYLDNTEQLLHVYQLYKLKFKTELPVVTYNYLTETVFQLWTKITAQITSMNKNHGPGIGYWSYNTQTLLVGEKQSLPMIKYPQLVFASWRRDRQGCGAWLAEQLESWGVYERDLYWVNALDPRGQPINANFIKLLRPRQIIALGNAAANWLTDNKVTDWLTELGDNQVKSFYQVPHPQYWKRFHHHEEYPLRQALKEKT